MESREAVLGTAVPIGATDDGMCLNMIKYMTVVDFTSDSLLYLLILCSEHKIEGTQLEAEFLRRQGSD